MSYLLFKRGNDLGGWIVFLIAAFVYGMTIEPTASFWDCPAFLLHPLQPDFDVLLKPVVLSNLLFLAVLASLVCYVLWNVVLKQLGTVRASNYIYLNPLVTMVASVIILHEKITWITLLGPGCIIFGVYQAEKK